MTKKSAPGTISRRGNSFCVRFMQDGQRYTFSIKTDDRREAERFALQKFQTLPKLAERRAAGIDERLRMSALLNLFASDVIPNLNAASTRANYASAIKPMRRYFVTVKHDPFVAAVHTRDIEEYQTWRRNNRDGKVGHDRPLSAGTIQRDHAILYAIFSLAERREYRPGNPVRLAKSPNADARQAVILTADQYDALLRECERSPMLWFYALVLGEAGLRCESEALWLQWADVKDGFLEIVSGRQGHRTKSGKSRRVPLSPRLAAALRSHAAQFRLGGGPWIFSHGHTEKAAGDRIQQLRPSFNAAAKRAGLPVGFHAHDLRHRAITLLVEAGISPTDVQAFAGHADIATTMGYFHASGQHVGRIQQMWTESPPLRRAQ